MQKDNKEIANLAERTTKLREQLDGKENEKQQLKVQIADALQEKLTHKLRLQEQSEKFDTLITENASLKERIFGQDE